MKKYVKLQNALDIQSNLDQKKKAKNFILADFRLHCKAEVIQAVWHRHK
jgi:hypothetical protein